MNIKFCRQWFLQFSILTVAVAALTSTARSGEIERTTRTLEGWTVHIDNRLLAEQKEATEKALTILTSQLKEIIRVVPEAAVVRLREVPLWFSKPYTGVRPTAEYHQSADWLRRNKRDPVMAKGVEFTDILDFERETVRMPLFVLHELAHGYHDRVLSNSHPDLLAAYAQAVKSKSYDNVARRHGVPGRPDSLERAYAMTNVMEYFAECTEAYYGSNDFYPFTRDDLEKHDPTMHKLVPHLWNHPEKAEPKKDEFKK